MSDINKLLAGLSLEQRKTLLRKMEKQRLDLPQGKAGSEAEVSNAPVLPGDAVTASIRGHQDVDKGMSFSLLFFSGDGETDRSDKYELLIESAKFADKHGFRAVWTPERHFQVFGGLFPNPSVLGAALSMITSRIKIRAGSIVVPLHNPIRIAEEWAVVDNLSAGRVELSFASGYHPGDFTLAPENYSKRKEIMYENIHIIRKLWAGDTVNFKDLDGEEVAIRTLPRAIQKELPIWITSSSSAATWVKAGEIGANVLTGLPGIGTRPFDELANKIALYRQSLAEHNHGAQAGKIALMLHTYVGSDMDCVREKVRKPLSSYLRTFIAQDEYLTTKNVNVGVKNINDADKDAIIAFALDRFIGTNSLIGTPDTCAGFIARLKALGINEIACFIDFGLDTDSVLESLEWLAEVRLRFSHGADDTVDCAIANPS